MVVIFLVKIIAAAIFDFYRSGRLGRERRFLPSGWATVKRRERGGDGATEITPARD